jgi:hypothetical protein
MLSMEQVALGWESLGGFSQGASATYVSQTKGKALAVGAERKESNEGRYSELKRREVLWMADALPVVDEE